MNQIPINRAILLFTLFLGVTFLSYCGSDRNTRLQLDLTRSVSKLPFIVALDKGLYEKYGLEIEARLDPPEFPDAIELPSTNFFAKNWQRLKRVLGFEREWRPDILVSGANGQIVDLASVANPSKFVFLAATDCTVSERIVARKDIATIEELRGKRIGVSQIRSNSGYIALLLADKMGWDPIQDVSIMSGGNSLEALEDGLVDAFVASEREYAKAMEQGYPILADLSTWGESFAGNSVRVHSPDWLIEPENRDTVERFLRATIEGISILHQDKESTLDVLARWHGITEPSIAEIIYDAVKWIPRKPYPCYAGIKNTMERYNSNEMRKVSMEDFIDDSIVRKLDESGFIDSLYEKPTGLGQP